VTSFRINLSARGIIRIVHPAGLNAKFCLRIPALAREIINSGETISALSGVKG
jgi:hypothetical protein